jgi:hypothetical protein
MKKPNSHPPDRRRDRTLFAVNAVLIAAAALIIAAGWLLSESRTAAEVGTENRFLTTEWYLLQELKAQTDKKLQEKDVEIEALRRRYEDLKALNTAPDLLLAVEEELRRAQAERAAIATVGLKSGVVVAPVSGPTDAEVAERWKALEHASEEWRQRAETLQTQLAGLAARNEALSAALAVPPSTPVPEPAPSPVPTVVPAPPPPALPSLAQIEAVLAAQRDQPGTPPAPVLGDIRTKLLIRALLKSPEIRGLYPDLLDSFDRYTEATARREYVRGGAEAYQKVLEALEKLPKE